jgi:hAT family C-terminal dimerisation region
MLLLRSHLPMLIPSIHSIQEHALRYPILARVARDYLPIQGSAVKCERAFSSSGQTITDRRNSLHPRTVGALQILKSAYANGYISENEEVRGRVAGVHRAGHSCITPTQLA